MDMQRSGYVLVMPTIERTITVDTPLPAVWDFLTDFTTTEQWDPPTVSTTLVSGDGGVGSVYRNVSKILGRKTEIEYTVVELEPQATFRLQGRTSSMTMVDTMTFHQDDGRTVVRYTAEFSPEGAAKLIEPFMPLGLKKLGDDAAKSMERELSALA
jgi:carbon monoxide dehydrogenase subunit G